MFTTSALAFDPVSGALRRTATAPNQRGNTPTFNGVLSVSTALPVVYAGGIGFDAQGRVCVVAMANPHHYSNGIGFDINNRVAIAGGAVARWSNGLPRTAGGALCVAPPS